MSQNKTLKHLAIIMDGNGRWAESRGFMRFLGHINGKESVRETIKTARKLGIQYLTLYTFSEENWGRPQQEVGELMKLLGTAIAEETEGLNRNGVRLNVIGETQKLNDKLQEQLAWAMEQTANNKELTLTLAISYSAKQEITLAAKRIAEELKEEKIKVEDITKELFESYLDTKNIPAVDLLIRTGGENRVSNFLLWQIAYAELYFTTVLWPDFNSKELEKAVEWFSGRSRRFGLTKEQIK